MRSTFYRGAYANSGVVGSIAVRTLANNAHVSAAHAPSSLRSDSPLSQDMALRAEYRRWRRGGGGGRAGWLARAAWGIAAAAARRAGRLHPHLGGEAPRPVPRRRPRRPAGWRTALPARRPLRLCRDPRGSAAARARRGGPRAVRAARHRQGEQHTLFRRAAHGRGPPPGAAAGAGRAPAQPREGARRGDWPRLWHGRRPRVPPRRRRARPGLA
mmetsp:Transcript_46020/g.149614  ORF Transcript_46020/g.149614 Transcript_46020/m.149614 type:complete len:214 (+) Transcript_46020:72-713(+)